MEHSSASPTRAGNALLVGTDEVLLYTRKQILQKHGFQVSTAEPDRAIDHIRRSRPEVVIACHTLTTEEADVLVEAARAMLPAPALVGFSKDIAPLPANFPFDASVWSLASPETFVTTIYEVLQPRNGTGRP